MISHAFKINISYIWNVFTNNIFFFIDAGAKLDLTDMDGRDAKRIAQEMHYDEIVYQLNTATLTGIYMNYYI